MQGMNSEFDYAPLRQRRFTLPADADCVGDADLRFCAILTHLSVLGKCSFRSVPSVCWPLGFMTPYMLGAGLHYNAGYEF